MKNTITIDISMLALPGEESTKDDICLYINRITDLAALNSELWIKSQKSNEVMAKLMNSHLWPSVEKIQKLIKRNNVVHVSQNDVSTVINTICCHSAIEDTFSEWSIKVEKLNLKPDLFKDDRLKFLKNEIRHCLLLHAVQQEQLQREQPYFTNQCSSGQAINLEAKFESIGQESRDAIHLSPTRYEAKIDTCNSFENYIYSLDAEVIEALFQVEAQMRSAINIYLLRYAELIDKDSENKWKKIPSFRIGENFARTIKELSGTKGLINKILRAIAEVIYGMDKRTEYPLRQGEGANEKQRMRGEDKAYRKRIDNNYRLHYWRLLDGRCELVEVIGKNKRI